jgi:predicted double-glycine peptidase
MITLLAALIFAAPSLAQPARPVAQFTRLPDKFLPVPYHRQETNYSCGAAAVLTVLQYWRVYDGTESSLYERLGTDKNEGTHPRAMVDGMKAFGLDAELKTGLSLSDLETILKDGKTAIVDYQAWRTAQSVRPWSKDWDDGHYSVLVAMDARNVYMMDPSTDDGAYGWVPRAELLERWRDYETRGGTREEYVRMAIVVSGKTPLAGGPRRKVSRIE